VIDFAAAFGLMLVIEGLLYAAFGGQMQRWIGSFLSLPVSTIRAIGLVTAGIGLVLLWAVRG
jgi:uncharacterized protein YjeT (DUF2065 family)